jgi:tetratricopeptide (TPR) repeat protein
LRARPNSAEANHYLGRAQLLKGNNLAEALRFLRRAAEIDQNRAEYWLYIGWAANDAGQPGTAEKALRRALELDQSLADAYWQRGILLRRQGAVRDAERDLSQALQLKPSRFEAHATLAECFEDQSRWDAATTAWKKAIAADGNRPFWRYKLGRLYYNGRNRAMAAEELKRAVQLAAKESRPPWLWEAYLMLADASRTSGRRSEAVEYYREYLKLAPPDSPFRADAVKALQGLGAPWDG